MDRRTFLTIAIGVGLTSFGATKFYKGSLTASSFQGNSNLLKENKNISIRDAANQVRKYYGTAISETAIEEDIYYNKLITRECSVAVTNGAFKWIVIEPLPGQFNFTLADKAINFCAANNIKLRGHTLVWHMAKPDWLAYPPSLTDVERHFQQVMGRYRNNKTLYSWDIVNEVVADKSSDAENETYGLRKGVKPEYIRDVFQIAASIDKTKEFVINDYGCEDTNWKQKKYLNLIKYLKNSGVKLDAVGLQSHI
jgi:endo-1,4-beta-xylanase